MIYYFAYGSNLHPQRIGERVPSAKLLGVACIRNHKLMFHKLGVDDSGKCSLLETEEFTDRVYGAIYELDFEHKTTLDKFESLGKGYVDKRIELNYQGTSISCFTYLAQREYIDDALKPFHWYKKLVLSGAKYLKFPEYYLRVIESIESNEDPDSKRKQKHEMLLRRMWEDG